MNTHQKMKTTSFKRVVYNIFKNISRQCFKTSLQDYEMFSPANKLGHSCANTSSTWSKFGVIQRIIIILMRMIDLSLVLYDMGVPVVDILT